MENLASIFLGWLDLNRDFLGDQKFGMVFFFFFWGGGGGKCLVKGFFGGFVGSPRDFFGS